MQIISEGVMMKKRRLLVTGANGMVGSYVKGVFHDFELLLTDIEGGMERMDVRDPSAVFKGVEEFKPDIVLHLAAATDVDQCEIDPDWAYCTNAIGTQNVALACQKYNKLMIYISTAGVFQGDKQEPYTEFDDANPVNHYGISKLAGENIVQSLLHRYFIIRSGWMIGGGRKDKKFVSKIIKLMRKYESVRVVNDKFGNSTFAKDLLSGTLKLIETEFYGLYHMANTGSSSRYDVALEIKKILKLENIKVEPVSSSYFPLPAVRSRSEVMRNYKLDLLGMNNQRSWQEALREYLESEEVE